MKKFFSILLAFALTLPVFAQTYVDGDTTYEFEPYNYLQFQAGAGYTVGESSNFGDLLSPAAAISWGRQFRPVIGMRLGLSGWQSKGAWAATGDKFAYNYAALNADAMFSLTNLFCGWKPQRKFNLSAFVGLAANLAFNNDEAHEVSAKVGMSGKESFSHLWDGSKLLPVGRAGVVADFRCTDRVSLNLEVNGNITTDHYNSKHADNPDFYFNGLVGLTYKLGNGYKKTVREPEPEPVPVAMCSVCGKTIDDCQYHGNHPKCATCGKYLDDCEYHGNHPAPKPQPIIRNIFFEKNKSIISNEEAVKVQEIAAYLNGHPETKVALVGYADVKTGNAKINNRLSQERAAAVAKFLQEKCNIAADRISEDYKGDTVQPFAVNEENRVCICIAE